MVCLNTAAQAALSTPFGSGPHEVALMVCLLRGIDANAIPTDRLLPVPPMENWRLVIVEELMRGVLRRTLAML